jgi:hypothetical protein
MRGDVTEAEITGHMTNSKGMAGLLGPALIAISLSEAMNLRMLEENASPALVYLNGTLLFIAGLAIVHAHSRWTFGWPVLVTLVGWLSLFGGLARMFVPMLGQREAQNAGGVFGLLVVMLAAGIFLTYKAYSRDGGPTA